MQAVQTHAARGLLAKQAMQHFEKPAFSLMYCDRQPSSRHQTGGAATRRAVRLNRYGAGGEQPAHGTLEGGLLDAIFFGLILFSKYCRRIVFRGRLLAYIAALIVEAVEQRYE